MTSGWPSTNRLPLTPTSGALFTRSISAMFLAGALVACGGENAPPAAVLADPDATVADVTLAMSTHSASQCSGTFVSHALDHTTRPRGEVAAMVDGPGAGVWLDDLDGDGWLDIVAPNLSGDTTVLWNRGAVAGDRFDSVSLVSGRFRQAVAFDVDADGDRDVLLSTGIGPPNALLHDGARGFDRSEYRTRAVTYSMAPGDLDGDGSIAVITGSYNAELTAVRDNRVLNGIDVGVAVTRPTAATLTTGVDTEYLTASAQALGLMVVDLDGDRRADIVVGNDLGTPDMVWLGDPGGLLAARPFDETSLSTMSLDVADVDGDLVPDLVATDMRRLPGEPDDVWAGVEADIEQARVDDIQQPRNTFQLGAGGGRFAEVGEEWGMDATGWSWSGVLGDLDHDGALDLYVVNGMQATGIFDMLPDGELVEPNQAFRNTGDGFELAPEWGLASTAGGRGMAMGDVDGDGDLDIVVNNLGAPLMLFENQLCGSPSVIIDPIWTGVQNLDALGTTVTIAAGDDASVHQITGARGYLSTSQTVAHRAVPDEADVFVLIEWPDGAVTTIDDVEPGTTVTVTR